MLSPPSAIIPEPPPRALLWAIAALTAAGKLGDVAAPVLAGPRPLLLLALNANDLHCGVTLGASSSPAAWFAVAFARRLAEDPLFFYLGWAYRDAAVKWARQRRFFAPAALVSSLPRPPPSPGAAAGGDSAAEERAAWLFRRAAWIAVVVEPGALVCSLAGAARMNPAAFACLNACGTGLRLALIRTAGTRLLPGAPEVALAFAARFSRPLLALTLGAVLLGSWGAGAVASATDTTRKERAHGAGPCASSGVSSAAPGNASAGTNGQC